MIQLNKFNTNNPTKQQIRDYERHGSELVKGNKYKYTHEEVIIPIIINCRVLKPRTIEYRSKLRFKQYGIIKC